MKREEKVWWLALADQYEEWADDPPTSIVDGEPYESYTCDRLDLDGWDWGFTNYNRSEYPGDCLPAYWQPLFGSTIYPAGRTEDKDREAKRIEFCIEFAEYIRENVAGGE